MLSLIKFSAFETYGTWITFISWHLVSFEVYMKLTPLAGLRPRCRTKARVETFITAIECNRMLWPPSIGAGGMANLIKIWHRKVQIVDELEEINKWSSSENYTLRELSYILMLDIIFIIPKSKFIYIIHVSSYLSSQFAALQEWLYTLPVTTNEIKISTKG